MGIIQSLLVTCRLHGVDPYTYLVDVLQRISEHPASASANSPHECGTRSSLTTPCPPPSGTTSTTHHHTEHRATSTAQIARLPRSADASSAIRCVPISPSTRTLTPRASITTESIEPGHGPGPPEAPRMLAVAPVRLRPAPVAPTPAPRACPRARGCATPTIASARPRGGAPLRLRACQAGNSRAPPAPSPPRSLTIEFDRGDERRLARCASSAFAAAALPAPIRIIECTQPPKGRVSSRSFITCINLCLTFQAVL